MLPRRAELLHQGDPYQSMLHCAIASDSRILWLTVHECAESILQVILRDAIRSEVLNL